MPEPVHIAFRNMDAPIGLEDEIRERIAQLHRYASRITACSVMVEAEHRHHRHGRLYHVRIDVVVPGKEVVVRRESAAHHANQDLHTAIRDAFDAVRRQLQDHARQMRGDIKTHTEPEIGHIARLFPNHGFLATTAGDEIYLHRNSVLGKGFDQLAIGDAVRYVVREGEGEHGDQASTVVPL